MSASGSECFTPASRAPREESGRDGAGRGMANKDMPQERPAEEEKRGPETKSQSFIPGKQILALPVRCQPYFPHRGVCVYVCGYTCSLFMCETSIGWTPVLQSGHKSRRVCVCLCL